MTVLLGVRNLERGQQLAASLHEDGIQAHAMRLDITVPAEIRAAADRIDHDYGRLDVLINSAGGYYDGGCRPSTLDMDFLQSALDTNLLGAWRTSIALLPLMRRQGRGRIVNVSSSCASSDSPGDSGPAYRISKSALNGFTRMLAAELEGSGILVNAVCPGWTATEFGGGGRPVAEGAAGVVWAACLPDAAHSGGFFRDGRPLPW
jgi:NAD(P)-dependent dehydrogenase (short-subunit alcohol dehydrogenase family)